MMILQTDVAFLQTVPIRQLADLPAIEAYSDFRTYLAAQSSARRCRPGLLCVPRSRLLSHSTHFMKLNELKAALARHPETTLRFILPNGEAVPAHAHVTEVARIEKRFIDCGGTLRNDLMCRLQTWTANDYEHRLMAGKLLGILNKAGSFQSLTSRIQPTTSNVTS